MEEANTNSMDVELPISKDKEVEYKGSNSILPEIKDHTDSVRHSVGIPQVLEEFQMDKEEARNKEVFASASLSPEKMEYLHDWRQNSYAVYGNVFLPSWLKHCFVSFYMILYYLLDIKIKFYFDSSLCMHIIPK